MADFSEIIRWFKDLRALIDTKPVTRWGVITNTDPLLVQLDGDDRPIAGSPSTIIGGLTAGERVLCLVQNRRVTVLGRGGAENTDYLTREAAAVSEWQDLDLVTGWTTNSVAQFRTDGERVYFRGDIGRAANLPASWTRGTGALPENCRPEYTVSMLADGLQGSVFRVQVTSSISFSLSVGTSSNRVSLDGLSFEL